MSDRIRRLNEAIREVLGVAVGELSDPRLGFVTITGVDLARDKRSAKVFFSVLGDDSARARTGAALTAAHGVLQSAVSREVRMHSTPQLKFLYDETGDNVARIERLLAEESAHGLTSEETQT